MSIALYIFAGLFALASGVLLVYTLRANQGALPYKSRWALPVKGAKKDPQTWVRVHKQTVPLVGTAAIVCLIQAFTCAWVAMNPQLSAGGYGIVIIGIGIVLPLILCLLALITARP